MIFEPRYRHPLRETPFSYILDGRSGVGMADFQALGGKKI